MNRIRLLALLPILCLPACNNSSVYGKYSFGLGKTDGSHFGISVDLYKEDYPGKEGMKKMKFTAEFGDEFSIQSMIDTYKEKYPIIEVLFDTILKDAENISEINCYYSVSSRKTKNGAKVNIGSEELNEILKKSNPDLIDALGLDLDLKPEDIALVLSAYVTSNQFTLQIPVSLNDVQQQLLWYGRFLDFDNPTDSYLRVDLESIVGIKDEDRLGTHPVVKKDKKGNVVEDQVTAVNTAFKYEFSHTALYDDSGIVIGKFVQDVNANNEKVLYFYPAATTTDLNNLQGVVYTMDLLGNYDYATDIKFTTNPETHETNVTYNHEKGTKEGFTDENGQEFEFNKFIQAPFVFRDFHDVMIGLKKE